MDVTALMAALLNQLWFLLPLLLLVTIAKSPWFKGMIGEWLLNLSIRLFLDRQEYHLLSNVTLPLEQNPSQLAHLLASQFGAFFSERKNIKLLEEKYFPHSYLDISDTKTNTCLIASLFQHLKFPSTHTSCATYNKKTNVSIYTYITEVL